LKDVIDFNEVNRERRCPTSDRTSSEIGAERSATSQEYLDALAANHRLSRAEGIDFIMDKFKLDALVAPTGGPPGSPI